MFSLQVTYPLRRRKVSGAYPPPAIFAVLVVLGAAVTLAMLIYEFTAVKYTAAVYITSVTVDFFTVAFAFIIAIDVIIQQPIGMSEHQKTHYD